MCTRPTRPTEGATVALALETGSVATPDPADDLVDALLEVRAARERLRRVDSVLAALLAGQRRQPQPQNAESRANRPAGPAPRQGQIKDIADVRQQKPRR